MDVFSKISNFFDTTFGAPDSLSLSFSLCRRRENQLTIYSREYDVPLARCTGTEESARYSISDSGVSPLPGVLCNQYVEPAQP